MTQPIHPMLERVASKIMEARDGKPCKVKDWYCEEQENPHVAKALRQARAAVQALMEPDEKLLARAEGYSDFMLPNETHDNTKRGRMEELRQACQAMLRPLVEGEGRQPVPGVYRDGQGEG